MWRPQTFYPSPHVEFAVKALVALVLALLLSGCAGSTPNEPGPTTQEPPARPPPKQIFEQTGNDPTCTQVLNGERRFTFIVDEGYDRLEVSWHASGLGQVGYEIRGPNGRVIGLDPYNPGDQPCNHAHTGGHEEVPAVPGEYAVIVNATGVIGWHLLVNEVAANATGEPHHH
jgi:hypothetical protein